MRIEVDTTLIIEVFPLSPTNTVEKIVSEVEQKLSKVGAVEIGDLPNRKTTAGIRIHANRIKKVKRGIKGKVAKPSGG